MSAKFKITGGDKLTRHLKSLPPAATEEVRAAIKRQAAELVGQARAAAPVYAGPDKRAIPGALRDAIRARFSQKGLIARVGVFGAQSLRKAARAAILMRAGVGKRRAKRMAEAKERDAFYARFVEFGTQKMAARPFLHPTFRAARRGMRGEIAAAVVRAIKKTTR